MKYSLAAVLLGALAVSAQTSTECNPLKQSCPADPALSGNAVFDLTNESPRFHATGGSPTYGKDGASLTIGKRYDAPKLTSDFYIMFGYVEWVVKAAPGQGIVSSAVLLSDCLDEIDWEILGSDPNRVQSNFFGKGDTTTYDRVQYHNVPGTTEGFHKYAVDWTADKTTFYIDGQQVRELTPAAAKGQYPQTPMRVLAGSWAGGDPSNNEGTIEWAGGKTDFSKVPFTMLVKSISVTDYSTGKEYRYSDMSGKWESIDAVGGKVNKSGQPGSGPKVESSTLPSSPSTSAHAPVPTVPGGGIGNPQAPSTGPSPPKPTPSNGPSSTMTSLAGLPSSWIVTETGTGGVVTPTSAAVSRNNISSIRSYLPVFSICLRPRSRPRSGNGGHGMTPSSGSGSTPTGTGSHPGSGSGSGPAPTGISGSNPTDGGASPTSPAMQAPGSTGAIHSVSRVLVLSFCAMAAWAAL
ncbi:cell wall protein [Nannizzia gypsea CBS 118893]|uniref:Cell wall protein n=1 Tax=Arthroderma gypseum (strain ATCC MYA-4604 / CBS 118893) TaxID=535722 RepID=E4V4R8_ARTGP|nr:cell wall protein [Nannizzia gypsea CBS 118893]EFR04992.1 cell wall protein [Nannizzia gypsea CBS 118893]